MIAAEGSAVDDCILHIVSCLQELEDQNRGLEGEIAELRELRDQEGFSGDVKELELELKVGVYT